MTKSNDKMKEEKTKSKVQEYAEAIIIAILIALFIRTFIIAAYKIPSRSMEPTLLVGDHLLVNKFIYGVKIPLLRRTIIPVTEPKRGDIIVFIYPHDRSKDFIKRVIGVGGDKIEIRNKKIFLNGKEYTDNHGVYTDDMVYPAAMQPRDNFGPVIVPPDNIFVMGDNRDESADSRFWGFVHLKDVEGKALIIYWSWNSEEKENILGKLRWNRLGNLLH
ncbi:MAG TPA: signal peptidase I [Smithellaceae bacterium]|jgi:signal peptidase I|nr:signal peptidase I [Syntrophaceae bacterium]MDX9816082.1 signal peptidase I [Smithellaceae bacterium]MBP8609814.1 signal peptidase I [Syntrophaceae bacterium]HNT90788.1 signal peptidase I [Smithellaceae bacterium]HPG54213.1 signal peptidase I [Smithellaceae bacterium]